MKSKDNNLQLHQCLGHGSPSTTSLSFGRGRFDFLVLDDGLGLDDCGLSGVAGGLFCGTSSSEEVQRKGKQVPLEMVAYWESKLGLLMILKKLEIVGTSPLYPWMCLGSDFSSTDP